MPGQTNNLFVDALPQAERELLLRSSSLVLLPLRSVLAKANKEPLFCYFLVSGIASAVAYTADGEAVEIGLIGRESVVGGPLLFGQGPTATESMMQLSGAGFRIRIDALRRMFTDCLELRVRMIRLVQADTVLTSPIAACQAVHDIKARLSRWLLMAQDRTGLKTLRLTQEFLAEMLGTSRTTVAVVAGALQQDGLVEYRRDGIQILDREHLIQCACSCYPLSRPLVDGRSISCV